jgi:major membrane immunogen (membrane-anchored lipoprotein)
MIKHKAGLILIGIMLMAADSLQYNDGSFKGVSQASYTYESYYGMTTLTIEQGKITRVDFMIRDSAKHEDFNALYEKNFEGNELYINQCRENWKGVQAYPDSLIKYQSLDKVDAVSGATWAYNIFRASAEEALKKAE